MKNEIPIPLLREEDFVAANMRRDEYALKRDKQALEFNQAIVTRAKSQARNKSKCEKCGKEFDAGSISNDSPVCPECK